MMRLLAHLLIRFYQLTLSAFVGRHCRYLPSCSDYADQAIARHGVWAGGWMAAARVCRCHPWGGSGFDPVPETRGHGGWQRPWLYGRWSARRSPEEPQDRASNSAAKP